MKKTIVLQSNWSVMPLLLLCLTLVISCQKENNSLTSTSRDPEILGVKADKESSAVAADWFRLQNRILLERNSALNGVYYGYIGIGLYEAVRPGIKGGLSFSTKLYQMPAMPEPENNNGYSWPVSANAALASMVRSFFTGLTPANMASIDSLESAYDQKLNPDQSSEVFRRSQAFGRSIATAIHNWFLTDNFNGSNAGYIPPVFPGSWVPTPPAFVPIPVNPYASAARPFMASSLTAIAPKFPLVYDETPGSPFYNMVMQVYDVSLALTPAEKETALYWVDQGNGVGYTPHGHDFMIVTEAIEQTKASLAKAAETYAKAGIAERDATIVCFRSKYDNNLVRPVTYIRKLIDPNWLSFIPTPPHPEYPAAHAYVTGSVMQAVAKVLGENIAVTDHSYDFRGFAPKTFTNIFAFGENAGISRLYGGIHYLASINEGLLLAKALGTEAGDIRLK